MKQNKIALVTGGSRGLGKNMALELAKRGLDVILTYHTNTEEAEKVSSEINANGQNAVALQLNTAKIDTFPEFIETLKTTLNNEFGATHLDYLVNNAGTGVYASFFDTTEEQFDAMMNIHLKGPHFLTQGILPFLADGGGIVNISTGLTRFSLPGYAAYSSMKGGIEVFTKYLAKELGDRNINANVVAPGAIETDFGGGAVRDNKDLNNYVASLTALGRAGLPEDIGSVVAFLCTDDAKWINAQRIEVSGGQSI
ncbi:SDR family oxidoreductase [Flavobacteriaceae bacterium 3-367]